LSTGEHSEAREQGPLNERAEVLQTLALCVNVSHFFKAHFTHN